MAADQCEVEELDESGVDTTVSTMLAVVLLFTVILIIVNVFFLTISFMTVRPALNLAAEYTAELGGADVPIGWGSNPEWTTIDFARAELESMSWLGDVTGVSCGLDGSGVVATCEATVTPVTIGRVGSTNPDTGEFTGIFGSPITVVSNGAISFYQGG